MKFFILIKDSNTGVAMRYFFLLLPLNPLQCSFSAFGNKYLESCRYVSSGKGKQSLTQI